MTQPEIAIEIFTLCVRPPIFKGGDNALQLATIKWGGARHPACQADYSAHCLDSSTPLHAGNFNERQCRMGDFGQPMSTIRALPSTCRIQNGLISIGKFANTKIF